MNTLIQLKWSDVTSAPTTLSSGEAAYSNTTHKLFIGDTAGNVLTIGGKYFTDQQGQIFTKTNVAFDAANSAGSYANSAFATANASSGPAGSYANSAFTTANSAGSYANSAFGFANTTYSNYAYPAYIQAGSAAAYANSAFAAANAATATDATQNTNITNAGSYANAAFLQANTPSHVANSAAAYANAAFIRANNSVDANNGGTITGSIIISGGNLSVSGNLIVNGNTVTQNVTTLNIADPLIYLAANNYTSDIVDIGFVGNYYDGSTQRHTGLFRDSGNKEFYVFNNYDKEPDNNEIDVNDASFRVATINANVKSQLITLNGQNLQTYVDNSYNAANIADAKAVTAGSYANSAFATANSAGSYANAAFLQANTPSYTANSAASYANAGFAVANSAASYANSGFSVANSASIHASAGFAVANSAASYANAAFAQANTDYTTITATAGYYGNGATISSFTLEANGRISQANSTLIGIAASQITTGTLDVVRGGTGAGTFTTNGVLLGQGTSAFTTASSSTEGHVLTINASGVPTFSYIQGGTF